MVITDGAEGLVRIEPSLADGQQGLTGRPVVWVVRVLESERVVTYIVIDGTDAIYEMGQEGDASLVGGTTGDPVVTPGPWPPDGAVVVALASEVGAGQPPVQAAVIDESGRLISVAEKGTVDPSDAPIGTSGSLFDAYAEPGMPGRVHVVWGGGICDSRITLTVAADLRSITFDTGPQPENCDSLGVTRELVLDFEGSVDVPAIELRDAAEAGARDYTVECGPLEPHSCDANAAAIVAENHLRDPSNGVVSITFEGGTCGSYRVIFVDGTSQITMDDCFVSPSPS